MPCVLGKLAAVREDEQLLLPGQRDRSNRLVYTDASPTRLTAAPLDHWAVLTRTAAKRVSRRWRSEIPAGAGLVGLVGR